MSLIAFSCRLTEEDAKLRIAKVAMLLDDGEIDKRRAVHSIARIAGLAGRSPEWGFASLGDHPLAQPEITYPKEMVN
jgi:hypothetical protein